MFNGSGFSLPRSISSAISTIAALTGALRPSRFASATTAVEIVDLAVAALHPVLQDGRLGRGQREALEQGLQQQVHHAVRMRDIRVGQAEDRQDRMSKRLPDFERLLPDRSISSRASGFAAPSWMERPNSAVETSVVALLTSFIHLVACTLSTTDTLPAWRRSSAISSARPSVPGPFGPTANQER